MTRPRYDNHSTEFGLWLRKQPSIDSKYGYVATNLDYVWRNYKSGNWMLIEEKRYKASLTYPQRQIFSLLDRACQTDEEYKGFHVIQFENTSPDDGCIFVNGSETTTEQLVTFLQFGENHE